MSKLISLGEAVASVEDGSYLAFGGFAITRCVTAAAHELIRARKRGLRLTQVVGGMDTDLLVGAGCVRRLVYSGGSLDRFGPIAAVNRAILAGEIEVEEYSSLVLTLRLHAGALGLPFIPARSMLGSDLLANLSESPDAARLSQDPFTDLPVALYAPLKPDVAFVHVDAADEDGNAVIGGPLWAVRETALAAGRTVLLAESIVPAGSLDPNLVTISSLHVQAVAHVRYGAHPTAVFGTYDFDWAHLSAYAGASREGGDTYAEYLEEYVLGTSSHEEYLDRVGAAV